MVGKGKDRRSCGRRKSECLERTITGRSRRHRSHGTEHVASARGHLGQQTHGPARAADATDIKGNAMSLTDARCEHLRKGRTGIRITAMEADLLSAMHRTDQCPDGLSRAV